MCCSKSIKKNGMKYYIYKDISSYWLMNAYLSLKSSKFVMTNVGNCLYFGVLNQLWAKRIEKLVVMTDEYKLYKDIGDTPELEFKKGLVVKADSLVDELRNFGIGIKHKNYKTFNQHI